MRIEPAPYVFWNDERRQRFDDRRVSIGDRRASEAETPRARHTAQRWFGAVFGAQLLGQVTPAKTSAANAQRAYTQPEARTPLRPTVVKSA